MGRSKAIRNGSFGHLMNPENLSERLMTLVVGTLAAWTLATRSQFTTDFWGAQNKDDISPGRTAPAANTGPLTQSFLLFPEDAGRCNGQAKA